MAEDLGTRLLPVFDSPTGLPYKYVNLKTGKDPRRVSQSGGNGHAADRVRHACKLTDKPIFYDKAKRALVETYKRRSPIGLVGTSINVETGKWTNTGSHISAEIDSYYEYLLKCSILFGDQDCQSMWEDSISKINTYLADEGENMSQKNVNGPVVDRRAMVRARRHEHRQADRDNDRRPRRVLSRGARPRRRSEPSPGAAGFDVQDVEGPRDRAGGLQLQNRQGRARRLSAAARDRRVDLLSLPVHERPEISRDGRADVATIS